MNTDLTRRAAYQKFVADFTQPNGMFGGWIGLVAHDPKNHVRKRYWLPLVEGSPNAFTHKPIDKPGVIAPSTCVVWCRVKSGWYHAGLFCKPADLRPYLAFTEQMFECRSKWSSIVQMQMATLRVEF